jgi:hypothetical protein
MDDKGDEQELGREGLSGGWVELSWVELAGKGETKSVVWWWVVVVMRRDLFVVVGSE